MSQTSTAENPASVEPRLAIDRPGRRARIGARSLQLEPRGFDLLAALAGEPGVVLPKHELFRRIWGPRVVGDAALTQAIARLRRELGDAGGDPAWVRTVHGVGYAFDGPLELPPAAAPEAAPRDAAAPAQDAPQGSTSITPPVAAPANERASRPPTGSRRLPWLSGFVAGIAVLLLAWLLLAPAPTGAPQRLAIVPFDIDVQAEGLEYGELALPSLVGDVLEDRTGLTVVDASRVRRGLANLGVEPGSDADPATLQAIRDLFGADHVLFARLDGGSGRLALDYALHGPDGVQRGRADGGGVGALAGRVASAVADSLDVAYAAGIPVRRLAADEFVNEAFARGMQALLSGELPAAERYFLAALEDAPDGGWIRYELGNVRRLQGRFDAAGEDYARALALSVEAQDRNLAGAAETGLGLLAWRGGRLGEAQQHLERARERFLEVGNRANLAAALGNLGILADNRGELDGAQRLYEEALALYRDEGERAGESASYSNLAVIARRRAQLDRAADLQQRALDLQQQAGLGQMQVFSATHLAEIERLRGRWERAAALLDQAAALAARSDDGIGRADIAAARAALAADLGDASAAAAAEAEALAAYRATAQPAGEMRLLLLQAERLLDDAEAAGTSRAALLRAREIARELPDPVAELRADLLLARLEPLAEPALAAVLDRATAQGDDALRSDAHHALALATGSEQHLRDAFDIASASGDQRRQALLALELARWQLLRGDADIEPLLGRATSWRAEHPQLLELRACQRLLEGRSGEARALLEQAAGQPGQRSPPGWCPAPPL